jgi:biotin carboxylase
MISTSALKQTAIPATSSKPCLLLISQPNSYRIAPYIRAAERLGIEVLIASRGEHSLITEVNKGLHIDLSDHDSALKTILAAAAERPFAGILGSDDSTVELAARAASELALPHNPPAAARASRRKDLARAQLALAGCPVPAHCLLNLEQPLSAQIKGVAYPCVVKPLNLSASRGVIRADDADSLIVACERIRPIIAEADDEFERNHVLLEDYIDGVEVAFEGYLQDGELKILALFDKPEPLTGPYFEETIYVTPSQLDDKQQQQIFHRVQQACAAYGLHSGPVHAELRVDADDAWILEIASRTIGGDCGRTLDNGAEFNLEELAISLATNRPCTISLSQESRGVMMLPIKQGGLLRRVEGLEAARKTPGVDTVEIIISDGHELIPLPEGNQYPGYIFARGETPNEVINSLKTAHAHLNFIVAPVWR